MLFLHAKSGACEVSLRLVVVVAGHLAVAEKVCLGVEELAWLELVVG